MSNFFKIILIFILLASCSFNKNSKFWNKTQIIKEKPPVVDEIFKKEEALNLEFNSNLKISLYSKSLKKSFLNNYDNNNGRINYDGNLKNISKFNFSRIKNFYQYDPKISFSNNDIIFFDNKGTILKFDDNSNFEDGVVLNRVIVALDHHTVAVPHDVSPHRAVQTPRLAVRVGRRLAPVALTVDPIEAQAPF